MNKMAKYIYPECGNPIYLTDEQTAVKCGRISGLFSALFLSIVIIIFTVVLYLKSDKIENKSDMTQNTEKDKRILYIGFGLVILVWILPFIIGFIRKRKFQTYQIELQSYMNSGMTRNQAIQQLQTLEIGKMTSRAITGLNSNRSLISFG